MSPARIGGIIFEAIIGRENGKLILRATLVSVNGMFLRLFGQPREPCIFIGPR